MPIRATPGSEQPRIRAPVIYVPRQPMLPGWVNGRQLLLEARQAERQQLPELRALRDTVAAVQATIEQTNTKED